MHGYFPYLTVWEKRVLRPDGRRNGGCAAVSGSGEVHSQSSSSNYQIQSQIIRVIITGVTLLEPAQRQAVTLMVLAVGITVIESNIIYTSE